MLHAAGGRRFIVFDIVAGELLPLSNTLNGLLNEVSRARPCAAPHAALRACRLAKTAPLDLLNANACACAHWKCFWISHPKPLPVVYPPHPEVLQFLCSPCETLTAVTGGEGQVNNALDAVNKALNRTLAPGLNPKPNAIRSWTRKFVVRWIIPLAALCALCHAPAPCTLKCERASSPACLSRSPRPLTAHAASQDLLMTKGTGVQACAAPSGLCSSCVHRPVLMPYPTGGCSGMPAAWHHAHCLPFHDELPGAAPPHCSPGLKP